MPKYPSWPTTNQGNIVGTRLANELYHRFTGGLNALSLTDQRDAALAELLATTPEVFNIKSFGAKVDGVTDDSTAIQATVDDAPSRATVVVPVGSGACIVNTPIAVTEAKTLIIEGAVTANNGFLSITGDDVHILGEGSNLIQMTRTWNDGNSFLFLVHALGVRGLRIKNCGFLLTLTGTDDSVTDTKGVILIQDNAAGTVGSVDFGVTDNKIEVSATQPTTNQRSFSIFCWSRNADPTILAENGAIEGNKIFGGGSRIIQLALCKNVSVSANVIRGVSMPVDSPSIRLIGSQNIAVVGNTIENSDAAAEGFTGVTVGGDNPSRNIAIVGNTVRSKANSGAGIIIRGDPSGGATNISVVGNSLWYEGLNTTDIAGIRVLRAAAVPLQDILITANQTDGWTRTQVDVHNGGGGDPSNVLTVGNSLGQDIDGIENPFGTNVSNRTTSRIITQGNNQKAGTGFQVDRVATADLPTAGATQNDRILIEDGGSGDRNLILYAQNQRFRIDGGAAF